MQASYEDVVKAVQMAAFDSAAWLEATERVTAFCGARVGNLIAGDERGRLTLNTLSNVSQDFVVELGQRAGDPADNPRVRAALTRPLLDPYTDDEILSPGQRERHDLYEVFDRGDTGFASALVLYRQPGFLAGIAIGSPHHGRDGCPHDHERLRRCGILIRDAMRIQIALEQRGLEAMATGLDALKLGAFLCRNDGHVLRTTLEGEALLRRADRLCLREGRLSAAASGYEAQLQSAIRAAVVDQSRVCQTLIITDVDGADAMTIDVSRLPTDAYALAFSPAVLVTARAIGGRTSSGAAAARKAYGLTAAETDVAAALAAGQAPEDIAAARGVSLETIRAQIRSIYGKTGVTRVSKLVRLVEGLA
ncbi:MAG: helix-turn-helix transcriptional regulator [Proteobacteria bacterium]|nr:helix-turn-helix transcriptional regulator [Pseudomonadota bacterium]MBW3616548.1 helix-turn-helix transcriptional regulator [Pseudomonadota bacterium]